MTNASSPAAVATMVFPFVIDPGAVARAFSHHLAPTIYWSRREGRQPEHLLDVGMIRSVRGEARLHCSSFGGSLITTHARRHARTHLLTLSRQPTVLRSNLEVVNSPPQIPASLLGVTPWESAKNQRGGKGGTTSLHSTRRACLPSPRPHATGTARAWWAAGTEQTLPCRESWPSLHDQWSIGGKGTYRHRPLQQRVPEPGSGASLETRPSLQNVPLSVERFP
jgi:hypothetical protein